MIYRIAAGLAVLFSFVQQVQADDAGQNTTKKEWTFLIYVNGNNNLEDAGYDDIREMEAQGSDRNINVVVQFGALHATSTRRIFVSKFTGHVEDGVETIRSTVVQDMPIQDMGSTQTMIDFLTWGMQTYPANHVMAIVWNHGSGWSKEVQVARGVSYDDISGNYMKTNEFGEAIHQVAVNTGQKIDILGFDACLMSMLEIADSLSEDVNYLVSSEETIPWDGFPYDDLLKDFASKSDLSARALAKSIVLNYGLSYSHGSQGTSSVTLSAVDLSKMENLKSALTSWTDAVGEKGEQAKKGLLSSADSAISFSDSDYKDLASYVQGFMNGLVVPENNSKFSAESSSDGFIGASQSLMAALHDTVVENFTSSRFSGAGGLSIYLPYGYSGYSSWSSEYSTDRHDAYLRLKFAKSTGWPSHLDYLFPKTNSGSDGLVSN